MEKEKVINTIKQISESIPIVERGFGIVSHPLIAHMEVPVSNNGSFGIMILNKPKNIQDYLKEKYQQIEECDNFDRILCLINKPYRITILIYCQDYLTKEEFNKALSWVWTNVEFPHQDKINILVKLFEKSDKNLLMDKEKLDFLESLPEEITVYRGLQGKKAKKRGLSWTIDLQKAIWFSKRFAGKGEVLEAKISKKAVFMYTNSRGEK